MRARWLVFWSFAMLSGCAALPPSPDGAWEQQIRAAEERHRAAFLTGDLAAMERMFSDDLVVNSPLNTVIGKAQVLELVRRGALAASLFEQKIEQISRFGDVVVVMGEDAVVYAAPAPNEGQHQRRRFTDIWRWQDGQWRFVARQATILLPVAR